MTEAPGQKDDPDLNSDGGFNLHMLTMPTMLTTADTLPPTPLLTTRHHTINNQLLTSCLGFHVLGMRNDGIQGQYKGGASSLVSALMREQWGVKDTVTSEAPPPIRRP